MFIKDHGWIKVIEDVIRVHASRQKEISASNAQLIALHSISSSIASPGVAITSLLLNTNAITETKEFHNIILNLNFAALNVALLQEVKPVLFFLLSLIALQGIVNYSATFEGFKKDLESCFKEWVSCVHEHSLVWLTMLLQELNFHGHYFAHWSASINLSSGSCHYTCLWPYLPLSFLERSISLPFPALEDHFSRYYTYCYYHKMAAAEL